MSNPPPVSNLEDSKGYATTSRTLSGVEPGGGGIRSSASNSELPPSKKPPFALRWLTYLLLIPLVGLATAFFGCISLVCGLWDKSGRQQHAIARLWARTLLLISLSPVKSSAQRSSTSTKPPSTPPTTSATSTPPSSSPSLPFQFRILAKQSLWKIPFIGWYLNRSGQVPVDLKRQRSVASLNRGVATLKSGLPLVLFPEGGRAADGRPHLPLRLRLHGHQSPGPPRPPHPHRHLRAAPHPRLPFNPRPLKIVVGDPIPTTGLTTRDADALTQHLYDSITTTYSQYRKSGVGNRE